MLGIIIIFFWLHKEFYMSDSACLFSSSTNITEVWHTWPGKWNQVLDFQHPSPPNCDLSPTILLHDTTGDIRGSCSKKFVFVPWRKQYGLQISTKQHTIWASRNKKFTCMTLHSHIGTQVEGRCLHSRGIQPTKCWKWHWVISTIGIGS